MEQAYDRGTQALIDDLLMEPPSDRLDEMLELVRALRFHDYDDAAFDHPKYMLAIHLRRLGLEWLVRRARAGAYDQDPAEAARVVYDRIKAAQ